MFILTRMINQKNILLNNKKMSQLAPKIKLNNGQQMPILGLGTWQSLSNEAEAAVRYAIDSGYRHIDTAFVYQNEKEVGQGINTKINEGVVKREDLFIVTKLPSQHHNPKAVENSCRKSLNNLNLHYVDLYLIHFPVGDDDTDYVDTWGAMEHLVELGLTKGIGLSNFNSEQTNRILNMCKIKPVVNQVECHPGFNQKKLIEFSKQRDIIITAYSPLGRPDPKNRTPEFLFNPKMDALASKYGKNPAHIALRYLIQLNVVPIPKSVNKERIQQNFKVFDFELSADDMKIMESFNTNHRIIEFTGAKQHKYYPFKIEF